MTKNKLPARLGRALRAFHCRLAVAPALRCVCAIAATAAFLCTVAIQTNAQTWGQPVWSDEFDSRVTGTAPDSANWTYDVGAGGWGNHELEIYCPALRSTPKSCDAKNPNAFQDGTGHLIIRARRVSEDPAPTGTWTSTRMRTTGLRDFQYGRMESCMKLPAGAGLWPAFWMMGTQAKWPVGGEIDIMENIPSVGGNGDGLGPTKIEGTIHGPSTSAKGLFSLTQVFTLPDGHRIDDTNPPCHVYGAIISPFMIQIYVDDWRNPYYIRTAGDVPSDGRWVYNAPFYFILNLAVGGDWPGPPDHTTPAIADMVVDYVRVYKASRIAAPEMTAPPLKMNADAEGSTTLQLNSAAGSGYVFVGCAADKPDRICVVDTGSALNKSVADFSKANSQTARVTLKSVAPSSTTEKPGTLHVTITAYTVSGEQSSITIASE